MKRRREHGISLFEIIAVMAVLIILMALLMGVISRFRESTKKMTCANNLRQIGLAMHTYASANKDRLPTSDIAGFPVWLTGIDPYLRSMNTYLCPSDRDPSQIAFLVPGAPQAQQGTFSQTVFDIATITVTKAGPGCGDITGGNHHPTLKILIPSQGYDATITADSRTWQIGAPGAFTTPGFTNVKLSDIQFTVIDTYSSYGTPGMWQTTQYWRPNGVNPYLRDRSGFYTWWGIKKDASTMLFAWACGGSEYWFYGKGYSYEPGPAVPDVEQYMFDKAAGLTDLTFYDLGIWVSVDVGTSSQAQSGTITIPPIQQMGDQKFSASYAYNNQASSLKRQSSPKRIVLALDYVGVLAKPTTEQPDKIAERHLGKRVNVLWLDGSVESVTFKDLATISGGTAGFKPDVWLP
jgi:prepilin-type processing-associated H-X9-DG protein